MTTPLPNNIHTALAHCSEPALQTLQSVRQMILDAGQNLPESGGIVESLKWGQPSYTTKKANVGSSLRLGVSKDDGQPRLYVICNTDLIAQFAERYPDQFPYHGKRAVGLDGFNSADHEALSHCIALALTYKQRQRSNKQGNPG